MRVPIACALGLVLAGCGGEQKTPLTGAGAGPPVAYSGPEGPAQWGELREEWAACGQGAEQSPVDLGGAVRQELAPLDFAYAQSDVTVADNGRAVSLAPAGDNALRVGDEPAGTLQAIEVHTPAEHLLGPVPHPLELHFVHAGEDGRRTIVAVFARAGDPNPALGTLLAEVPGEGTLDPAGLLPAERTSVRYRGSLTAPPCMEGVEWIVLTVPIALSPDQIVAFTARHPDNQRPLQPVGARVLTTDG